MNPEKGPLAHTPDRLDDAIDRVAAGMTNVNDAPELAARIVASLPERVTWFGWLSHSWAPRLALIVIIAAAGWLVTRSETASPGPDTMVAARPVERVEPLEPLKRLAPNPVEPLEPLEPLEPNPVEPLEPWEPVEPDFERSLPAIEAVAALALAPLSPASLPEDEPLTVAPLAIADLPLTAETISPR